MHQYRSQYLHKLIKEFTMPFLRHLPEQSGTACLAGGDAGEQRRCMAFAYGHLVFGLIDQGLWEVNNTDDLRQSVNDVYRSLRNAAVDLDPAWMPGAHQGCKPLRQLRLHLKGVMQQGPAPVLQSG